MGFGSKLSSILNGATKGFVDNLFGSADVQDYRHGSRTFLDDGYALAPQTKYLFHVYFTLNQEIPGLKKAMGSATELSQIGMMVKSVGLPKFNIDVDELNQYNRTRYIQKKIKYDPVSITFHDDGSDLIRSMWYNYFTYYYSDARHQYNGLSTGNDEGPFDFNKRDIYDHIKSINNWGFNGTSASGGYKPNFFKDIKVYGLNRGNFVEYILINPIITNWEHDQFAYNDIGGMMEHRVTLKYETVKYNRGTVGNPGSSEVEGFGVFGYDETQSSLSKAGGRSTIFGAGGLLDAGASIAQDLEEGNFLGAALTAGTSYRTFKDAPLGDMLADEGVGQLVNVGAGVLSNRTVQNSISNLIFQKDDRTTSTVPPKSLTSTSNNGYSSATNWNNPNTGAPAVNTNNPTVTSTVTTARPWINPNNVTTDPSLNTDNNLADISSNGSTINKSQR